MRVGIENMLNHHFAGVWIHPFCIFIEPEPLLHIGNIVYLLGKPIDQEVHLGRIGIHEHISILFIENFSLRSPREMVYPRICHLHQRIQVYEIGLILSEEASCISNLSCIHQFNCHRQGVAGFKCLQQTHQKEEEESLLHLNWLWFSICVISLVFLPDDINISSKVFTLHKWIANLIEEN